jgi:hypothetical protein
MRKSSNSRQLLPTRIWLRWKDCCIAAFLKPRHRRFQIPWNFKLSDKSIVLHPQLLASPGPKPRRNGNANLETLLELRFRLSDCMVVAVSFVRNTVLCVVIGHLPSISHIAKSEWIELSQLFRLLTFKQSEEPISQPDFPGEAEIPYDTHNLHGKPKLFQLPHFGRAAQLLSAEEKIGIDR